MTRPLALVVLVLRWARERLPPAVFGPVIAALGVAAWWTAGAPDSAAALVFVTAGAGALVIRYRFLDDVADRERDRCAHPERRLPRAPARDGRALVVLMAVAHAAVVAATAAWTSLALMAALDAAALAAYRLRPRLPDLVWRYPLLLAKYPAFVAVAAALHAPPRLDRLAITAALAWTVAVIHDARHDARAREVWS